MARISIGIAAYLLLTFTTAMAQQSAVDGIVVNLGTGEALADAQVVLTRTDGPSYTGTTGGDGKFAFQNVESGEYRLTATRAGGFMPTEYGQRNPNGGGIPFTLTPDRRLTGVRLAMAAAGTISGRIFNRDGTPAVFVSVQALRPAHSQSGQRSLSVAEAALSNDLGEFRLFWLPPGRYYLSAGVGGSPPFVNPLNGSVTEAFAAPLRFQEERTLENGDVVEEINIPAYFPGTTDIASASPIEVTAGSNLVGMDFILADPIPARHVRGTVINGDTGQPAMAEVNVVPRALSHDSVVATTYADKNGAFDISGITPGSYIISASLGERRELTAYHAIEVAGADLNGITLNASKGHDIAGRLVVDRGIANFDRPLSQFVPTIQRDAFVFLPPPQPFGVPRPNIAEDGSFVIQSLANGDYRVSVSEFGSPASDSYYLKSIRLGASDVLTDGLHVDGKPNAELEIVLGTDVAALRGTVVNQKQEPLPNAVVAMIPYPIGSGRQDLYKNGATDVSGQFRLRGIAPGDYIVFAWDDVEASAWQDPEFARSYESVGKRIHIGEAANETIELTIFQ
jgi:Carboxypeptidase regulatory-like domain